jgi:hypothetical protein
VERTITPSKGQAQDLLRNSIGCFVVLTTAEIIEQDLKMGNIGEIGGNLLGVFPS